MLYDLENRWLTQLSGNNVNRRHQRILVSHFDDRYCDTDEWLTKITKTTREDLRPDDRRTRLFSIQPNNAIFDHVRN